MVYRTLFYQPAAEDEGKLRKTGINSGLTGEKQLAVAFSRWLGMLSFTWKGASE